MLLSAISVGASLILVLTTVVVEFVVESTIPSLATKENVVVSVEAGATLLSVGLNTKACSLV